MKYYVYVYKVSEEAEVVVEADSEEIARYQVQDMVDDGVVSFGPPDIAFLLIGGFPLDETSGLTEMIEPPQS